MIGDDNFSDIATGCNKFISNIGQTNIEQIAEAIMINPREITTLTFFLIYKKFKIFKDIMELKQNIKMYGNQLVYFFMFSVVFS